MDSNRKPRKSLDPHHKFLQVRVRHRDRGQTVSDTDNLQPLSIVHSTTDFERILWEQVATAAAVSVLPDFREMSMSKA